MLVKAGGNIGPSSERQHRCCMAVVSSCREMLGSVPQRAQLSIPVASGSGGDSGGTDGVKPEEGGDDVKSSRPLRPGRHTCYNAWYSASRTRKREPIAKSRAKFGLSSATRRHEAGIASNRGLATPR